MSSFSFLSLFFCIILSLAAFGGASNVYIYDCGEYEVEDGVAYIYGDIFN